MFCTLHSVLTWYRMGLEVARWVCELAQGGVSVLVCGLKSVCFGVGRVYGSQIAVR